MDDSSRNSFGSRDTLTVGDAAYRIYRLDALERQGVGSGPRLPFSLRILLENLLRHEDGTTVTRDDIVALANWSPNDPGRGEIAYRPARVLLQDFTGVPALVDLAALRDAARRMGGDPGRINPRMPSDLVIDHSVQVDRFASPDAFEANVTREYERNGERYAFLRWGQTAFAGLRVVPPGTGICHQVNLEYLASVVFRQDEGGTVVACPDTVVGTDSHTPMVNGLGVVGWGVGGIEAEAAMLGQPVSMLVPDVVGVRLSGALRPGVTATDLVLAVTQLLRKKGVVGKFVEFYGQGLSALSVADRATISNMAPEYGATIGYFPVDAETLAYLRFTGRPEAQVALVEAYCKAQGLFRTDETPAPVYSDTLALDLSVITPCLAGPRRPQDRVSLPEAKKIFLDALAEWDKSRKGGLPAPRSREVEHEGETFTLRDGSVVIAAVTSCTNTSNPTVMMAAGLLARKAVERGLSRAPWVKTSLAPGSKVVTRYLDRAGLTPYLEKLGFHLVGYGCTTCIGNSGPLPPPIDAAIREGDLVVCSVLSGNRNFEGRIHPASRANYLASPPLVIAYALAGRMDIDLGTDPLGVDNDGKPVYLRELWPSPEEVTFAVRAAVDREMFLEEYANVFAGDDRWKGLPVPAADTFSWDPASTYVKEPPYFVGLPVEPVAPGDIRGARVLAMLGDSVTTDHISPAGDIPESSPAGRYLLEHGIAKVDFNSYGSRRGNHEVMMRGTFANIRLRNALAPGTEGGVTVHLPSGEPATIFDAAMRYSEEKTPLVILAGKEYGSGSSRDWAAKGPKLLGVVAVIAESFERIHRSNLVGMGLLPLQFEAGQNAATLGLTGRETFTIEGIAAGLSPRARLTVRAAEGGREIVFAAIARIDTPEEIHYHRHGGILPFVLRRLAGA
ncbi:MAG TPA: aconitate hydratase AcnA [Candidatus Deferrimicrobiaceae bacterium]|jgi:aconitate hydratase